MSGLRAGLRRERSFDDTQLPPRAVATRRPTEADAHSAPAPLRYYDFFAGAGLVRLALEPEWSCVWANDHDRRKATVYAANFGPGGLVVDDITRVRPEALPPGAQMAWASFPCQDLSLAGWRKGLNARRSGTFWTFWRIMRDLHERGERPPLLVIENVPGLLYGDSFTGLCEGLAGLDLQFGALVLDARWFVPQSRPRVFVVAVDRRLDCARFQQRIPANAPWFPQPCARAWRALPSHLRRRWRWWRLPTPSRSIPEAGALVEDRPIGVKWHSPKETQRLLNMMTRANLEKVRATQRRRKRSVGFLYRRTRSNLQRAEVRFDGLAGCLRTPSGGSSRQTLLLVEEKRVRSRLLSPREAARLMGVSDSFLLPPSYNDAYRAMGDGVAVPVVKWLSDHLLTSLARSALTLKDAGDGLAARSKGRKSCSLQTAETFAAQSKATAVGDATISHKRRTHQTPRRFRLGGSGTHIQHGPM